jgi:hypothetical protein
VPVRATGADRGNRRQTMGARRWPAIGTAGGSLAPAHSDGRRSPFRGPASSAQAARPPNGREGGAYQRRTQAADALIASAYLSATNTCPPGAGGPVWHRRGQRSAASGAK